MGDYAIRPFEVMPYNIGTYIIKNPTNFSFHLITEYQAALLEQLEKDNRMANLLFPAQGIATSKHMEQCILLFKILKKIELIEDNREEETTRKTKGLYVSAEGFLEIIAKCLSYFREFGLFLLVVVSAIVSVFLLPTKIIITTNIFVLVAVFYFTINICLITRELFRAGFLKINNRKIRNTQLDWKWIFFSVRTDTSDIWMNGYNARLRMALLGLFSPFCIVALFSLGLHFNLVPQDIAGIVYMAGLLTILLLVCPLLGEDGEEIFHLLMYRDKLESTIRVDIKESFHGLPVNYVEDHSLGVLLIMFGWTFFWLDTIYNGVIAILPQLLVITFGWVFLILSIFLFLFPATYLLRILLRKKNLKKIEKKEISWEEKKNKLEKIPLFALLKEEVRELLLREMDHHSFQPGDYLVKQAEQGSQLFILLNGEAQAIFKDATGKRHIVGSLKEGDAFGEVALIDDVPRTASVVARTYCEALTLNKENFLRHILQQFTEVDRIKQMIRLSSFFKRHPLLSKMSAHDQAILIEKIRFQSVAANEELMGRGVQQPKFSLVYTGRLVMMSDTKSDEFTLETEDCFGYLLSGQNSAYLPTIKTKEGSGLLVLNQEDFKLLLLDKITKNLKLLLT